MEAFADFIGKIDNPAHKERTEEVLTWVTQKFPNLVPEIKWNQPIFSDHGTYIIGFSIAKHHLAVAPEKAGIIHFFDDIVETGYGHTKELVRIPWDVPIDFTLLKKKIEFNIMDKMDCTTFWR